MSFAIKMKNQNIVKRQNCFIWIHIVSLYTLKERIFIKTFQKIFGLDFILQIMN